MTPDEALANLTAQAAAKVRDETNRATAIAIQKINAAAASARNAATETVQEYLVVAIAVASILGALGGYLLAVRKIKKELRR